MQCAHGSCLYFDFCDFIQINYATWNIIPTVRAFSQSNGLIAWWRHQMETFSALLALCAGKSPVSGEFPAQRPVTRSFDVFFDLRQIERLSKHSRGWWFETPSIPLCRHCNDFVDAVVVQDSGKCDPRNSVTTSKTIGISKPRSIRWHIR